VVLWAVATSVCGESWGAYGTWKVRRTVGIPPADAKQPKMRGRDCVYVTFPTAEFLQPEGADLRVTIGGEPPPFKIIDVGYGGYVRLVAGISGGADRLHIYYGNPSAKPLSSDWEPRRGVWLETRTYKGGKCETLAGMREALSQSSERIGAGLVGQIFHGFNPFGPADNYLSIYRGWFYLPKDTTVTFAVVADEIGYLFVEDKLVAAKRQWGAMPRHKRFAGEPLLLREGVHPIRMYHVERGGGQAAGAAWWIEGMRRGKKYRHFQIIPPNAFAPVRYGKLLNYEVRGQAVGADFSYVNDGDVLLDNKDLLIRYVFRDTSRPANRALQCQPSWEFGDGTTSESRDPNHVYFRPGDYTVTLTLKSPATTYRVRQRIRVGPGYERSARRQWDGLAQYYPIIKDYQFDKMATEDLILAARVFEELEKPAEIIAVCKVLYVRGDDLDDTVFVRHCLLLGRHLREFKEEEEEDPDEKARERAEQAIRIFTRAEQRSMDVSMRARLANEKGDVYYYFLRDLERAEAEYIKTITRYAQGGGAQVRIAQIRIGDLCRTKGDCEAALKAYQRAADMPVQKLSENVATTRRGSFPRTAEDYLRRKLFEEAHKTLDAWDWEIPTDRLVGYSTLLRARLALAEGNSEEAVKQAQELIRCNKESEYADDLLLFLADLYVGEGELDKALAVASQLLDDHPASDLQDEAHLKRVKIRLQQAKYEEAASEALAMAGSYPESEAAPEALLLAATAQVRHKKRDDAIQTLERLMKRYPTADEATQALKMLKELRKS
jgi:TolA-binding protein